MAEDWQDDNLLTGFYYFNVCKELTAKSWWNNVVCHYDLYCYHEQIAKFYRVEVQSHKNNL